jgi:hypothetical protein
MMPSRTLLHELHELHERCNFVRSVLHVMHESPLGLVQFVQDPTTDSPPCGDSPSWSGDAPASLYEGAGATQTEWPPCQRTPC